MNSKKIISHNFDVIANFDEFINAKDDELSFPLSISKLAIASQTTTHTVRNYIVEGLLDCSEHTSGGYGLFDKCALNRLRFIRASRAAGLMVLDIKPVLIALNDNDEQAYQDAINVLHTKVSQKMTYLSSLESRLTDLK
ncbi:MAG: MerR family mercuric resistance operon transcriptional regulator [Cognaticolwellia sp.]|jgi:MerR family mercuric resistance operon transcriptional regulator|tara:strand:- start:39 stop:455 length:417 start_codon:yes stop_codon:yes gene_type:complete